MQRKQMLMVDFNVQHPPPHTRTATHTHGQLPELAS